MQSVEDWSDGSKTSGRAGSGSVSTGGKVGGKTLEEQASRYTTVPGGQGLDNVISSIPTLMFPCHQLSSESS